MGSAHRAAVWPRSNTDGPALVPDDRDLARIIAQIQPFQGKWATTVNMQDKAHLLLRAEARTEKQAKRWVAIWHHISSIPEPRSGGVLASEPFGLAAAKKLSRNGFANADLHDVASQDEAYVKADWYFSADAAIAEAKRLVETCMREEPGSERSQEGIMDQYRSFGSDPAVIGSPSVEFSAWKYAEELAARMATQRHST